MLRILTTENPAENNLRTCLYPGDIHSPEIVGVRPPRRLACARPARAQGGREAGRGSP